MGYNASGGPKGLGVITDSNTPLPDLAKLIELIARVGNLRVESEGDRDDIPGAELYVGLMVFNTTTTALEFYDGTGWVTVWRDTGWVEVSTFYTGWTEVEPVAWRVVGNTLHLVGRVNGDGSSGSGIFNIPAPYRHTRASNVFFSDDARTVGLTSGGDVICAIPNTGVRTGVILSGISTIVG